MIASQMGDTRYRGKLIWMLLTSRPDLLPIDLKRQGRAEVHLPLFNPATRPKCGTCSRSWAARTRPTSTPTCLPEGLAAKKLSGADIESIVLSAKRNALIRVMRTSWPTT